MMAGAARFRFVPRLASYRSGDRCPACGRAHWLVGRVTAECAWCATALPLALAAVRI